MTSAELSVLKDSLQQQDIAEQLGVEKIPSVVWPNRHRMGLTFTPIAEISFNAGEVLLETASKEHELLRRIRMLAAKRSVEDFLRHQSTAPNTSNPKGRFNVWHEEKLVRTFKIIEEGVALVDGMEKAAWEAEGAPGVGASDAVLAEAHALLEALHLALRARAVISILASAHLHVCQHAFRRYTECSSRHATIRAPRRNIYLNRQAWPRRLQSDKHQVPAATLRVPATHTCGTVKTETGCIVGTQLARFQPSRRRSQIQRVSFRAGN